MVHRRAARARDARAKSNVPCSSLLVLPMDFDRFDLVFHLSLLSETERQRSEAQDT